MKHIYALLFTLLVPSLAHAWGAMMDTRFNWSAPASLNPSFAAPTADNRYGEYIGGVTFTGDNDGYNVTFLINDDNVKELSQKARFLYGYNTKTVELRVYSGSTITITATNPEQPIFQITWDGAKVGPDYMSILEGGGKWYNSSTWICGEDYNVHSVKFLVNATINCTLTEAQFVYGGVDDIMADSHDTVTAAFTPDGQSVAWPAEKPGLYIVRHADGRVTKQLIH